MADTKVSALPAAAAALIAMELPVNDAGTSRKVTIAQIADATSPTSYDLGTSTIATEQFLLQYQHLKLSGSRRLAMEGTAEIVLNGFGTSNAAIVGSPKGASSFIVPDNYLYDLMYRLTLPNSVRADLRGSADLVITDDFSSRSRIVLAGRG